MQKEWQQKTPKKRFVQFLIEVTKKNWPKKIWADKATEFAGELRKLCKAEGIQINSTMSGTKAASAEGTKRSLKKYFTATWKVLDTSTITYCFNSSQQKKCSRDLVPNNIKISDFFPFCTASHHKKIENPSLKMETKFATGKMTYPWGTVTNHQKHKKFLKLLQFLPEHLQRTQWRMNRMNLSAVSFIRKEYWKSFNNEIVNKRNGFQAMHLRNYCQNYT